MAKKLNKPADGAKLPESADMKAWREEFEAMSEEEHLAKLKALGLSEEEIEEFKEMEEGGVPLEEELMQEPLSKEDLAKKKKEESKTKPKTKKK